LRPPPPRVPEPSNNSGALEGTGKQMSTNTLEKIRDGIGTTEDSPKSSCSECGSIEIVRDNEKGEIICGGCGLVLSDHRIDH